MISSFTDEYAFLSNFFETTVVFERVMYTSAEAAYQAAKTTDLEARKEFVFLSPGQAKRLGRALKLRPDWEIIKEDVMYEILRSKFNMRKDLKQMLLDTGDEYLEEGNTWHDNCWGNCSCPGCADIPGANRLGKLLMRLREELR